MKAPAGSIVSLYLDTRRQLNEGDVIQTQTGRAYRIVHLRQQTRGKHTGRWHIKALVLTPDQVTPQDRVIEIAWYRR